MADAAKKIRVLTDANILFAGASFPRWPREVLRHAAAGDYQLVLCPLIIQQAQRNLQKRFPEYLDRFEELLQAVDYELVSDPAPEDIEANRNSARRNHRRIASPRESDGVRHLSARSYGMDE